MVISMSTEKLYYMDSHLHSFSACVTACETYKEGWRVILDKTAFFPEGGGQAADTGLVGHAGVKDVHEKDGEIWHYTDEALAVGEEYPCTLDWEQRLRRMQNHSGEHIVSGITHALHGFDNVGFHMGEEFMTIDFDGELTWDELMEIEKRANEAVRSDIPVKTSFPAAEELAAMEYRSKLELKDKVRIVKIEGIDRCACCAPHVQHTGEIGCIKLLDSMRHRGGVRVSLCCGMDALEHFRSMQGNVTAISGLLSAKREDTAAAVERVLKEQQSLKERISALGMELVRLKAASFEYVPGNICLFDDKLDEVARRELVNALADKCSGMAAVFSGNDARGYKYIIGSRNIDLRARAKEINSKLQGRGGGSPEMIQGTAFVAAEIIQKFVESALV